MLRKRFSFVVVGTMLFLLAVFIAANASQAQAESRAAGQLQYWVTIEKDLASVRAQQGDFKEGPAAIFELSPATDRWQRLEQADRKGSSAPAPSTFGYAVAIDGDYAIVGAEWHDGFKGAAYIYKRKGDGWVELQRLSPPDLGRFDHFGSAVSINGDYAVVAATWQDLLRGAVYVFKREGSEWVQQDKLTASDARTDDRFGRSVRIDGSDITISNASAGLEDAGTSLAYRFRRSGDTWREEQKITLPALEESGAYPGELLIEFETSSDLLALAEIIGTDTEMPPLLAPTHAEHYFIRGDVYEDQIVDGNDYEFIWMYLEAEEPVSCEDAADVNDDGAIDWADLNYLEAYLWGEGPDPPHPFPGAGLDTTADGLSCGFTMIATDGAFEDRVEMVWTSVGLDAIVYRIERDGTLISLASSEDSLYADKTGDPAVPYNYCVRVVDMDGGQLDSDCDYGSRIIFPPEHVSPSDGDFDQFVRVTWDDMSSIEAGYQIRRRRGDSSDEWVIVHTTSPNVTVFDDETAVQEKRTDPIGYWYELIALDADGNESEPDSGRGWRSFIVPPAEVSASDGEYGGFVRITWIDQAENEDGYRIWRRLASQQEQQYELIGITADTIHFYEDYAAEDDSEYVYCVATFDTVVIDEGDTAWESPWRCDEGGRFDLDAPAYVIASDSTYDDCIEITWDDPSDLEDGFVILRGDDTLTITEAGATLYKDFTAVPDSTQEYCVFAFTEEGGSSDAVCDSGYRALVLAPFDVQASDGTREDRVDLTWKSSSTTAVLFKIFRDGTSIKSAGKGTRSYSDYGGIAGQDYEYKVLAVTALGVESDTVSDTGRRELKAPTPVTASDEEYEEKIVISWVDNSWLENGYRVFREDTVTHESDSVLMLGRNRTSLTDYSAIPGVTYKYTVEAFDTLGAGDGEPQGFSAPASDVGRRVLLPPTNVRASDGKFEKRVEITWEDNSQAEDGYRIYRDGSHIGSTSDNFTFFADTLMIVPGRTSVYRVAASDLYGESVRASDNGSTAILAPGSFNASDTYKDRVVLTWVDLSEVEDGYVISCDGDSIATTGENTTSYTDYPELPGKTYRYCIRAVAGSQSSAEVCDYGQFFEPPFVTTETYLDLRLVASDAHRADQFGWSVAIDGDVAIVGAPEDSAGGEYSGAAYIFTRQSDGRWTETQKLFMAGQDWDFFGRSVAIDGDVAIVGAPGDDAPNYNDRGSAYILTRDDDGTWDVRTKITPVRVRLGSMYGSPIDADPVLFGSSVAISGDFAIVGAPGSRHIWGVYTCDSVGVAYTIKRKADGTWPESANQFVEGGDFIPTPQLFGSSVAIDDNVAVVGEMWDYWGGLDHRLGSAHIFELVHGASWQLKARLVPSDAQAGDQFGSSVAVSGGTVIVGADSADVYETVEAGAAYVFTRAADGTWPDNETQKLVANDFGWKRHFGRSVAMIGGNAIVGAWGPPNSIGSAYLFGRAPDGAWLQMSKLRPVSSNPTVEGDYFGFSVALSDDWAIVGAYKANFNKGAAYLLGIAEPPGAVAASDGTLNSRVRIQWEDRSLAEDGFYISRDGEVIATLLPDVEVYEDLEAQPGRTYEYGVQAFNLAGYYSEPVYDFGWRPPNGNVTGRVATSSGAGVEGISVGLDPPPIRALLLDGNGGHARIPDPEGRFAFSSMESFTIEAWIKYSGTGGSGTGDGSIIAKGGAQGYTFVLTNLRNTGQPGRLHLDILEGCCLMSKRDNLNDGTWHHVAIVRDVAPQPRELRLYLDGILDTLVQQAGDLGDTSNTEDVTLGVAFYPESWFGGQIDEVRIWKDVARDSLEIRATMRQQLTGEEEGLVGYWPLDKDGTGVITDLTEGAHYGTLQDGAYWTENVPPIDVSTITDLEGNYALANVRYGQETTFKVTPSGEQLQFQPAFKFITLSIEHPVENQVDFVETTSFAVCGVIRYENTDCFVQNVEIHVDGQLLATTDKNGKFSVGVSKGDHCFKPLLAGHTFALDTLGGDPVPGDSFDLTINQDKPGVDFVDQTLRTISGTVSGGCDNPIGHVTITFRSENSCMDTSITKYTESEEDGRVYEVQLPPQSYFVSAEVDPTLIPPGLSKSDLVKFFENLGDRSVDLTEADTTLDFIYRAPLLVTIDGFGSYRTCPQLTFPNRDLPDFLPIIPQGEVVSCTIKVNEYYGDSLLCPLDSATVTIYDEIFDQEDTPVELVVKDGVAYYKTFASTPSLVVGRVDSEGNDRSFQKAFRARVVVEGRTPVTETEWVLVTGHVAGEGADFVTATSNPFPLYLLRDPPGDQSYAYLEKGYTSVATIDYGNVITSKSIGANLAVEYGVEMDFFIGLGAGKIFHVEAQGTAETNYLKTEMVNKEWKTEITLTTKEKFSTSPDELFVGGGGDVFVGAGLNFIFAKVGVVDVKECEVIRSTSLAFQPNSITTVFSYTQEYIQDVLVPQLEYIVNYYEDEVDSDSATIFRSMRDTWLNMLANNESLKQEATLRKNRSFSAGADFEFFYESGTTRSYTENRTLTFDNSNQAGLQIKIEGFGSTFSVPWSSHVEQATAHTDTSGTSSNAIGYVLSDNDIGDHFTVDIKEDGGYPSPVFDVLAGASSCPHEPWPDPKDGKARMWSRDAPKLLMGGDVVLDDVPPDEAAAFTLNLCNLSQTEETREYVLREITTANPGGAIIKANGNPIGNGLSYFISGDPLNNSNEVTLSVERGPTKYNYPDLALMLYPPCDDNIASRLTFGVNFKSPCSDITLLKPKPSWTFTKENEDSSDSVYLLLTDYELPVSEEVSVEEIGAQYRLLGTGRQGSSEWLPIFMVTGDAIDSAETDTTWAPGVDVKDGVYEVRAYTNCGGGNKVYSNVRVGTIDRNAPQVFGTPEPADGELSLGEDISITFNEPIDPDSIRADRVTLKYAGGSAIEVDWVCDGSTIIIVPDADPDDLEGRQLEASVAGICDLLGNTMEEDTTWTFTVRQRVFTWRDTSITQEVAWGAPGTITAELVNGSDGTANFVITTDAQWITDISPDTGNLAPGHTQTIAFTIDTLILQGSHTGQVVAQSECGEAQLSITLTVSCHAPVWSFDPGGYEYTMTIVATVSSLAPMQGTDRVGAFVGNQLRGVANMDSAKGLALLTVYSNRESGETVRFEVWDDSQCKLYKYTEERFPFISDAIYGRPDSAVTLTPTDQLPGDVQEIPLSQGWNWFSSYVEATNMMDVNSVLSNLTPAPGDIIKSKTESATFVDAPTGWSGTLDSLNNVSCYMIKLSEPGTILQEGQVVPPNTPIPVVGGWNWISYLPQDTLAVATALGQLDSDLQSGDMVKSQTAFAQWVSTGPDPGEGEWYGTLDSLYPGMGYKLYLETAPLSEEFSYPASSPAPPWAGTNEEQEQSAQIAEAEPGWSIDQRAYQYNMTVAAVLEIEGDQCRSDNDLIAAFVDGECRGMAQPIYLSAMDRYVAFLMIYSNLVSGETVEFQAFVPGVRAVYNVAEAITYEADGSVGSIGKPLILSTEGIAFEVTDNIPTRYSLSQNYPNPFNPMTTIEYGLPEQSHATIEVFNVLGQRVRTLVSTIQPAGRHRVVWDGKDHQGKDVGSGIYFYRLQAGAFSESKKMVILK